MSEVMTARGAWLAGSDAPELEVVTVGFLPTTDCASIVIAAMKGFDEKYGIKFLLSKEASWAAVRDKLINGELHASHALYGLIYGVHLGIGGLRENMSVLMSLNQNGQAITLSNALREQGVTDGESLARLIARGDKTYTFAHTFPTGTHAMWLYYWLASLGVHPLKDLQSVVLPPPQMVSNMRFGSMDGFCAGEPWNQRAIMDGVGFTAATSQQIWADHPEKVLGCTAEFSQAYPNTARAMICAILEASQWIDASPANRSETADIVASCSFVSTDVDVIRSRMLGQYENGLGAQWNERHCMKFCDGGAANFPYLSDGMWFMTQQRRWGMLKSDPDYLSVAREVHRLDLYREAAQQLKLAVSVGEMRASTLIDGVVWDGRDPAAYVAGFDIRA